MLVIGARADYGQWRCYITIIFTLLAVAVSLAWLSVEDPSKWQIGVILYVLGYQSVVFGSPLSFIRSNALCQ